MSGTVEISSPAQLSTLLASSLVVVVNFYNEENQSSKAIGPVYDQLASQLARPNRVAFAKVSTVQQAQIAQSYNITNTPTFVVFKNNQQIRKYSGSSPQQLSEAIKGLAVEAENKGSGSGGFGEASSSGSGSDGGRWRGASLPRNYSDVTDQVDVRGADLLNLDSGFGNVQTLFESQQPTSLRKGKTAAAADNKDWIESDVDNQLMLYVPFTSTLKVHTIQITSCTSAQDGEEEEEAPARPKTIHVWSNRQHNMGFEEAEEVPATQVIEVKASDWDEQTATAKLELRFVKFQKVYSLVLFVADADGDSEKTRIDRIRFIGESGEKRDPGKLEKVGGDD